MTPLAMFVGQRRCEIFGLILVTSAETCRRHGPVFSAATRLLQEKVVVLKGAEGGASCCMYRPWSGCSASFSWIPIRIRHSDWLEFLAPLNLCMLLRHYAEKKKVLPFDDRWNSLLTHLCFPCLHSYPIIYLGHIIIIHFTFLGAIP